MINEIQRNVLINSPFQSRDNYSAPACNEPPLLSARQYDFLRSDGLTFGGGTYIFTLVAFSVYFYFIPSSEFNAYLRQIKVLKSAVKKNRIFSLVTDTIYIFLLQQTETV